jgi:predicted nucleic acid-binding protein
MGNRCTVTDTGPVIHLSEIGLINCFKLFKPVYVPEIVHKELTTIAGPGFKEIKREFFEIKTIAKKHIKQIEKISNNYKLTFNDAYVIVSANILKAKIIFTDDLELRDAVKLNGLIPVGTIGILVRSYREKLLTRNKLDKALDNLVKESSLYITDELIYKVKTAIER